MLQLGQALKYMHSHKIIHRDIKLENVMLSSHKVDCNAKLADFGLAESLAVAGSERTGAKVGTAGYVAPEIIEGYSYGPASDIWSLGCLLYAMLTVSLPFPTPQVHQQVDKSKNRRAHCTVDYSQLDLDIVDLSENCKDLLGQLLVKDPSQRLTI